MRTLQLMIMLLLSCCTLCISIACAEEEVQEQKGNGMAVCYVDMEILFQELPQDSVSRYDALKLVASLQGLVNRESPQLLMRFLYGQGQKGRINMDDYWLETTGKSWDILQEIERERSLSALLKRFHSFYKGFVLWDPDVVATANVAATICGVDGLLPLRADSPLLPYLKEAGIDTGVGISLVGLFTGAESGSSKCDAYLWAKREYLDTGKCNPALLAFYIDAYTQQPGTAGFHYGDLFNTMLANHDYFISQRAFFFDLLVWEDEAPVDDPGQPLGTDYQTLCAILKSQYERNQGSCFTSIGGFVSWDLKYTNHGPAGGTREPVPTEWQYVSLFSRYNAFLDADALGLACLTNSSFYRHFPLKERYTQQPVSPLPALENKTYVLIYMGDYDSAAWLSRHAPQLWDDPLRGSLPIAWAFNPNLSDRVPHVFDYYYRTASEKDWFIAGDSGAGYLNPNLLIDDRGGSGLPEALDLWVSHNQHYYERLDYSITGFVINGFHGDMPLRIQQAYARFSPNGVGMQLGMKEKLVDGTPFLRHSYDIYPDPGHPEKAAELMASFARPEKPQFLIFRWILQSPSTMSKVIDQIRQRHGQESWEFCDPYTFFALYKKHLTEKCPLRNICDPALQRSGNDQ
ncbi:MAG: hypothetical protein GX130_08220 [Candidatus Hydrogenedens sp.]|nr:hypothetical protein [Candidatus Hydrogenedens sp.]